MLQLMWDLTYTNKAISRYPHDLNTKFYAVSLYRNGNPISFVCRRYKYSKASLMRWNKKNNAIVR